MDTSPLLTLEVRGFCSLLDASLSLRSGITIIRGVSNEGKSSLLKALYQLLYNPSGKGFINQSLQSCDIVLTYNNHVIQYHKTLTSSTKYTIDGVVYDKVVGPLAQVSELLGFTFGDLISSDQVNFWNQMSLPFLLYSSPKDRYEIISSGIYNLEDVRDLMVQDNKSLSKSIDDTNTKLALLQNDIDKLQSQVFDDHQLREFTDKFYTTHNLYTDLQRKLLSFVDLQPRIEQLDSQINKYNLDTIQSHFDNLQGSYTAYREILTKVKSFIDISRKVTDLNVSLENTLNQLELTNNLLGKFNVCPLCHNPINNCLEIHNNT